MTNRPLTVAWISYFPIDWMPDLPEPLRNLPRQHPATWQQVLLDELKKEPGLKLHVISVRKHYNRHCTFERDGVSFHCLKAPGGLRGPSLFWVDTLLIRRCLKNIQPDLIHAWGTENGAALVASRLKYPYFVTVQGLMSSLPGVIPVNLYQRCVGLLEKWTLSRASFATAESTFSAAFVRQHFPRLDVRQIEVVPDRLFHRIVRRPICNPLRFIFVGPLGFRKGGDLLLFSLEKLRGDFSFTLTVVGQMDEALMRQLKPKISDDLWSRIEFKQHITTEALTEELAQATMMIFPTRADSGPMAVKEAALAGVPVVGSAVGGIPDYIVAGKNGLVFASNDLQSCTNAIKQAATHPLFSRGQVDEATLAAVREKLSPERMAGEFFKVYRQVTSRGFSREQEAVRR